MYLLICVLIFLILSAFTRTLGMLDALLLALIAPKLLQAAKIEPFTHMGLQSLYDNKESFVSPFAHMGLQPMFDFPYKESFVGDFSDHPHDELYSEPPEGKSTTASVGSKGDDMATYYLTRMQDRAKESVVRSNNGARNLKPWYADELKANEEREWWNQDSLYDEIGRLT